MSSDIVNFTSQQCQFCVVMRTAALSQVKPGQVKWSSPRVYLFDDFNLKFFFIFPCQLATSPRLCCFCVSSSELQFWLHNEQVGVFEQIVESRWRAKQCEEFSVTGKYHHQTSMMWANVVGRSTEEFQCGKIFRVDSSSMEQHSRATWDLTLCRNLREFCGFGADGSDELQLNSL